MTLSRLELTFLEDIEDVFTPASVVEHGTPEDIDNGWYITNDNTIKLVCTIKVMTSIHAKLKDAIAYQKKVSKEMLAEGHEMLAEANAEIKACLAWLENANARLNEANAKEDMLLEAIKVAMKIVAKQEENMDERVQANVDAALAQNQADIGDIVARMDDMMSENRELQTALDDLTLCWKQQKDFICWLEKQHDEKLLLEKAYADLEQTYAARWEALWADESEQALIGEKTSCTTLADGNSLPAKRSKTSMNA